MESGANNIISWQSISSVQSGWFHFSNRSNCQAILSKTSILRDPDWPKDSIWDEWILNGGEDYELILTLPKEWAEAFSKKFKSAQIIGFIKEGKPNISWENSEPISFEPSSVYQHF